MDKLRNKVALVTGSSRGIGAAIARLFAREGARVIVHGRDVSALTAVCANIERAGGTAHQISADLTRYDEIEAMRAEIERVFARVGVLVANAGGNPVRPADCSAAAATRQRSG